MIKGCKELSDLEGKLGDLERQLTQLLRSDPAALAEFERTIESTKKRVNEWTDNIFILRQFVCSKMGSTESYVNEIFGIPGDLDIVD